MTPGTSIKFNPKITPACTFVCGVILTWIAFQIGLFKIYRSQSVDFDSLLLDRQMECKPQNKRLENIEEVMSPLVGPDIHADNSNLVSVIKQYFLDHPRPFLSKFSLPLTQTPQAKEVDSIFQAKTGGFFVECGGLDGERSSNTNWLEQRRGWNGLLIEMDPSYYMQLRGKNRKCFSINACLSPHQYPIKMEYKEHHMGEGRLVTNDNTRTDENKPAIHTAYCFPFLSIMMALNRTKIDYFSLDVEGMELNILKTIPFDKLDISVFSVEYSHAELEGGDDYIKFMESKGYKMVKKLIFFQKELFLGGQDFIFVKKGLST